VTKLFGVVDKGVHFDRAHGRVANMAKHHVNVVYLIASLVRGREMAPSAVIISTLLVGVT
jgi:hypothetical protein